MNLYKLPQQHDSVTNYFVIVVEFDVHHGNEFWRDWNAY